MSIRFDGKQKMRDIRESLKNSFTEFSITPELHIVIMGTDSVSERFIRMKQRFGEYIGVPVQVHHLDEQATTQQCQEHIKGIVQRGTPMGVIVQLPLPEHIDTRAVLDSVPMAYDVDVLSTQAKKKFETGANPMIPTVAQAIGYALEDYGTLSLDQRIVIVGNGALVGGPTAQYLRQQGLAPWVFDKESDPGAYREALASADIIISGVGSPGLIVPDDISEGVCLVDAGTSEGEGVLRGDIDPACHSKASWYTPVPGGIGPLTVAMIFMNLYKGNI